MTHLEKALELAKGTENTIEELEIVLPKGDLGLTDTEGLESLDSYIEDMALEAEYSVRLQVLGHNAKYLY